MRYLDKCFENDRVKSDLQDEIYKVNTRQARTTANLCDEIMRMCDERFEDIDDAHASLRDMYESAREIKDFIPGHSKSHPRQIQQSPVNYH